mgnify:CR=1 FL=1
MAIIKLERDDQNSSVAILTMNRPEAMNSFNADVCIEMCRLLKEADADPSVRVVILTGAGRAFCAGADISKGFGGSVAGTEMGTHEGVPRDFGGVLNLTIFEMNTPIIAAINGSAVGIGFTMTLPCDIRIAAKKAKYGIPFTRRGIVFDGASSWFLPKLVGFSKATEWSLRGDFIPPEDGLSSGLFAEVLNNEDVLPRALELAREMATLCSPTSLAQNKILLRNAMLAPGTMENGPFKAHMEESVMLTAAFTSADCTEGVKSFLEKRAPNFGAYKGQKA